MISAAALRRAPSSRRTVGVLGVAGGLAVGGAALASPTGVVGVLLIAVLVIAVLRWPEQALVATVATVPFHFLGFQVLTGRLHAGAGPLVYWKDALLVGLFLRGVAGRARGEGIRLPSNPADLLLVGYILLLGIVAVLSTQLQPAATALAKYVEGPLLLLAMLALRPSRRTVWACLVALLSVAAVMGAAALAEQYFQGAFQRWYGFSPTSEVFYSDFTAKTGYRSGSFFGDSLVLGFFLSGMTPVAFAAVMMSRRRRDRVLSALAAVLCLGGTVVTFTRSAYYGAGLGMIVVLALGLRNPRVRAAALGLLVVGAAFVATLAAVSGDQRILHSRDNQAHFDLLQGALDLVVDRPQGYGLGTTDYVAHRFNIQGQLGQTSIDSVYGDRAVESGVLGLAAYLLVLFVTGMRMRSARLTALRRGDGNAALLCAGALGGFIGIAAAGLLLPVQELPVQLVMWGAAGLALAAVGHPGEASPGDGPLGDRMPPA